MPEIVVGVRPVGSVGSEEASLREASSSIQVLWAKFGDQEIELPIRSISATASFDFFEVALAIIASGFRTVEHDSEEAPERYKRELAEKAQERLELAKDSVG